MGNKTIKYICFYDIENHASEERNQSPAAHQKVSFILSLLTDLGYDIEIISASQTNASQSFPGREEKLSRNISLRLFKTYGRTGIVSKMKRRLFGYHAFQSYVKKYISKDDIVLVYHSLEYLDFLAKLKQKIPFKLLLEMEELYSDANQLSSEIKQKELKLAGLADGLVLPTYPMNDIVNLNKRPYCVIHGDYRVNPPVTKIESSNIIKVVYSGTFETSKAGVTQTLHAAPFLPENVELYIMGFGSIQQTESVIALCKEKQASSKCKIIYLGRMNNTECEEFLSKCDIGIAPQNTSGSYNDSSFPSKVLTYLKNGLKVVSSKTNTMLTSDVSDLLFYYDGDDPQDIAKAIINAINSPKDKTMQFQRMEALNQQALDNLRKVIDEIGGDNNE